MRLDAGAAAAGGKYFARRVQASFRAFVAHYENLQPSDFSRHLLESAAGDLNVLTNIRHRVE
jgi:hypothetical protein